MGLQEIIIHAILNRNFEHKLFQSSIDDLPRIC